MTALRTLIAVVVLLMARQGAPVPVAAAQGEVFSRIAYQIAMPEPASHLFQVNIDVDLAPGADLANVDFQMPRWQPGRYAIADFAKNVQEFSAAADGAALRVDRADDQTWRVWTAGARAFRVSYRVFGNDLSGTFAQLDATHGNFNGGEVFMYVTGHKHAPVELHIEAPRGWRVINGRMDSPDQRTWYFPNYETLIDTPTEVGPDWTMDEFRLGEDLYRVVVHSRGDEGGLRDNLVQDVRRIVEAHLRMWDDPDFDTYTFLFHFAADGRSSDGMEHLTSTQIIYPFALADPGALESVLGTASHEFFHVWNVKRLRPVGMGPWDWTRSVNTPSLWIAEGLTEYYGEMMMHRAGLWSESELLGALSRTLTDVENAPGNRLMSAVDASLSAPFMDAAIHRQRTNLANSGVSYYTKGELIGLVLDLSIRGMTGGAASLDDVFRRMYNDFYVNGASDSYYLRGMPYTEQDFVRVLSEVAGTEMGPFYDRHIRGVEPLPYDEAFAYAGLRLTKTATEPYSDGLVIDLSDREALRLGAIRPGSPAQHAGLQQGDILVAVSDVRVNRDNWRSVLDRFGPGERVELVVSRFGRRVETTMQLAEPAAFIYTIDADPAASASQRALRSAWLSGR